MTIYTSYFAGLKNLPADIVPIGISRYPPKWYNGISYKKLAPTGDMLRLSIPEYHPRFEAILRALDPKQVAKEIEQLSKGKDCALICFERPGDFCHRHMVGNWLNFNGVFVQEFNAKEHGQKYAAQSALF